MNIENRIAETKVVTNNKLVNSKQMIQNKINAKRKLAKINEVEQII